MSTAKNQGKSIVHMDGKQFDYCMLLMIFSEVWTGQIRSPVLQPPAQWMLLPICGTFGQLCLLSFVLRTVY